MSYDNPRISMTDTIMSSLSKMSERNIGALTVLVDLMHSNDIDPDAALGGLSNVLALDTLDVYGSRIWQFYKDVCKCNLGTMVALLRANQLGYVSDHDLTSAIDGHATLTDEQIQEYIRQVQEFLPDFNINAAVSIRSGE